METLTGHVTRAGKISRTIDILYAWAEQAAKRQYSDPMEITIVRLTALRFHGRGGARMPF